MNSQVLKTGRTIEFPIRCDSAWLRRDVQMRITPDGDGLRYESTVFRQTSRRNPLPQPAPDAKTFIAMCSFCKAYRFPIESRRWKDIESLFIEPNIAGSFSVTHGICESCASSWLADFDLRPLVRRRIS